MRFSFKATVLGFLFAFVLIACHASQVSYTKTEKVLKVEEAVMQEEVPGVQDAESRYYLMITFTDESLQGISMDSITTNILNFQPLTNSIAKGFFSGNTLKIELKKTSSISFLNEKPIGPPESVTIYFKKQELLYRQTVSPIKWEEPIYLP